MGSGGDAIKTDAGEATLTLPTPSFAGERYEILIGGAPVLAFEAVMADAPKRLVWIGTNDLGG